jgi:hypothetical protein
MMWKMVWDVRQKEDLTREKEGSSFPDIEVIVYIWILDAWIQSSKR